MEEVLSELVLVGLNGYLMAFEIDGMGKRHQKWSVNLKGSLGIVHFLSYDQIIYTLGSPQLYAISKQTGELRWKTTVECLGSMEDNHLSRWNESLICSGHGYISAYSLTGEFIWKTNLKGMGFPPVVSTPCGDLLYGCTAGHIFTLSASTGQILWTNDLKGKGYVGTSVTLINNTLVVGTAGVLVRLDLQGNKVGETINLKGTGYDPISQLIWEDFLFCAGHGVVYCLRCNDLSVVWQNKLKGLGVNVGFSLLIVYKEHSGPSLICGFNGNVVSINPMDGKTEWSISLPGSGYGFVSLLYQQKMIIALGGGYLYGIDNTGNLKWKDSLSGKGIGDGLIGVSNSPDENSSNLIFARLAAQNYS